MRVLVTGATGHIGREVVRQLGATGCRIRALTRQPGSFRFADDVEVSVGDLTVPATLDSCLRDIDAVFLVWVAPLAAFAPALARIASRAGRIVLLTSQHKTPHPFFQQPNTLRSIHADIERQIEACGVPWTFLRPTVFALNCVYWWGSQIRAGNTVRWFHADTATAPIHERDVAAVAVRALCDDGHAGLEYALTGPESLTQREQVRILGEVVGRPLQFQELAPDVALREVMAAWDPAVARMLLDAYGAGAGMEAPVTSTVFDVTGTPARSLRAWALDHRDSFLRQKS